MMDFEEFGVKWLDIEEHGSGKVDIDLYLTCECKYLLFGGWLRAMYRQEIYFNGYDLSLYANREEEIIQVQEPFYHPIIAIQEVEMVLDELYCDFIRLFDDMLLKPSKIIGNVLGDDYVEYP